MIVSMFALSFCTPDNFNDLWIKISNSVANEKYFLGNFLGKNDDWNAKTDMTFFSLTDIENLFKNFEIIYISEKEYDKSTAMGKMKHWDIIEIIAKHKK